MTFRLPRLLRTSAFRLTLLYTGLAVLSLGLLLGAMLLEVRGYALEQQDEIVEGELEYLQRTARQEGPAGLEALLAQRLHQPLIKSMRYLLQEADGRVVLGNAPAQVPPREDRFWFEMPKAHDPGRMRRVRAHGVFLEDGRYLLVGEAGKTTEGFADLAEAMVRDLGFSLVAAVLLALGGGAVMSHLLLRRVERIDRDIRAIMLGDLARRLPVGPAGDEFDRLSASVNAMLERIQHQVDSLRQVSDDIAHDLRTPLTRLRQRLERARRLHDVDALRTTLDGAIGELDTSLRTFAAMLQLAQVGGQDPDLEREEVLLSPLLETMAEVYQPAFDAGNQTLEVRIDPGLAVHGNRDLLGRMLANLLENSNRHCPPGSRIELLARTQDGAVVVEVADDGPGIPPPEREKVLRRLYRLERSRNTPGNGLGLALVDAVARMHGARLELLDNRPGLRVRITLEAA